MKILYFHQYFATPKGATGTRSYEMARRMVARGHEVTMVCGSVAVGSTGLEGEFCKGRREGNVDGIHVVEFDLPYGNRDRLLKRTLTFLRYVARSIGVTLFGKYDLVFATSTPLTAAIPGIVARLVRRKIFVFEVRDLWPELPKAMGVIRNPLVLGLMSLLERLAYLHADGLVGLSPGISRGLARFGKPPGRICTVPNGCDLADFGGRETGERWRPSGIPRDRLLAVFSGAMGIANRVEAALDVAATLKARGRSDISILLIGDGRQRDSIAARVSREGLDNVTVHPPVPKLRLQSLLRDCDVGLQMLANVPAFYYGTSPNKFFDYLASGLPIIVNYPGWLADLVTANGCGLAVPPEDPEAFADALVRLADDRMATRDMGRRARQLGERDFDRDRLADALIDFVETTAESVFAKRRGRSARSMVKRTLDVGVAAFALVTLSPLLLLVGLLVRLRLGSPVLFTQVRPGLGGLPFRLIKFRSMTDARAPDGGPLPDSSRLTPFGRWLRSTSLDELPELWNVLRGDMSLVGPRPLLAQYLPLYSSRQSLRHAARPGITGWAQVNGRNALTWEKKFELDVWYVENWSLRLDALILWRTLRAVLLRQGISPEGEATMPAFTGTAKTVDRQIEETT